MDADQFNEWRRHNDLPALINFFKTHVRGFEEWLAYFRLSDLILARTASFGELFAGSGVRYLLEFRDDQRTYLGVSRDDYQTSRARIEADSRMKFLNFFRFVPFFDWQRRRFPRQGMLKNGRGNYHEQYACSAWEAANVPGESRALLFGEFPMLKLGGHVLPAGVTIGGKNLAFVDLDHLEIQGDWHGGQATEVSYSSIRHLRLRAATMHHVTFRCCYIEELVVENTSLQDFTLGEGLAQNVRFAGSKLIRPFFDRTRLTNLLFADCILQEPSYRTQTYPYSLLQERENVASIRRVLDGNGDRDEALAFFRLERSLERRYYGHPYQDLPTFQRRFPLACARQPWWTVNGRIGSRASYLAARGKMHALKWLDPRLLPQTVAFNVRFAYAAAQGLLWGYGTSVGRALASAAVTIIAFALWYWAGSGNALLQGSLPHSVIFSISAFTTLGLWDVTKFSTVLRAVMAVQSALGVFFAGLIVAAFSQKR